MATVSVIVPNYNHGPYLRQRLDSIIGQTFQDFELIVLDDCSTDDSRKIIRAYAARKPDIRTRFNSANTGSPFRQWDRGVTMATGEYIWIAESDDFAEPDFLERTVPILENRAKTGLVYCNSLVRNEHKRSVYPATSWRSRRHAGKWLADYANTGRREIALHLYRHNTINNVSGVLFRKKAYLEAGGADHSMHCCGDWFLYIRILQAWDIAYIASPMNTLRLHGGSSFYQYYGRSPYVVEHLRVYSYVVQHFNLRASQKLVMAASALGLLLKKTMHAGRPSPDEARAASALLISLIKPAAPL